MVMHYSASYDNTFEVLDCWIKGTMRLELEPHSTEAPASAYLKRT